ncbi:MAG: TolC family protein, partial [Gammaproteobacteria bacterium]|nr:TolC family protein [Gammaproteobacteria bacterium]
QRVGALGAALKSSESALEATQKGLEVGIRDNIDLLDAQKQVFSVKKDYAKARYDYHLSVIKLKEITGVLNEQDLFDLSMAMYKK